MNIEFMKQLISDALKEHKAKRKARLHSKPHAIGYVKEIHYTKFSDDFFYTYLICKNTAAGKKNRYNLYKINTCADCAPGATIETLGNEVTLSDCKEIIKKHEPRGASVTRQE